MESRKGVFRGSNGEILGEFRDLGIHFRLYMVRFTSLNGDPKKKIELITAME